MGLKTGLQHLPASACGTEELEPCPPCAPVAKLSCPMKHLPKRRPLSDERCLRSTSAHADGKGLVGPDHVAFMAAKRARLRVCRRFYGSLATSRPAQAVAEWSWPISSEHRGSFNGAREAARPSTAARMSSPGSHRDSSAMVEEDFILIERGCADISAASTPCDLGPHRFVSRRSMRRS
jgi:hypothetical protein